MLEISIILVEEYDLNTSLSFQLICLSPQLPNHYFFFVKRYVDNKPEGKTNSTIAPKTNISYATLPQIQKLSFIDKHQ